ncbi:MAG: asparaginase [Flavobacteriales bacterium]|nr:asparaginase [Flavobacteriales bacterium]
MKPSVLIIYTGGTIGMINDPETGELKSFDFDLIDQHVPELKRLNVEMTTLSFDHPIDSSNMHPKNWLQIGEVIEANYEKYDGFVVLHGSDTMAYTASALSFMFDGLKKPVIITGSQLPIGTIRTDGKENLITAIEIAATTNKKGDPIVQEVAIYFEYHLYRGNRSTKDSASNFEAIKSPNLVELATAGVNIEYHKKMMYRSKADTFSVQKSLNERVGLIKLYPGIDFSIYKSVFDRSKVDGIVLETFGAGNAPLSKELEQMCSDFIRDGGHILNITQCNGGSVSQGMYETSSMFKRLGVISGKDMTAEAAVTKMMSVLANAQSDQIVQQLGENLRGELTN